MKFCTFILSMILTFMVLSSNLVFAMGYRNRPDGNGKGLYFYSAKDFSRFFKDIGYSDFWADRGIHISRNSDGTALRFVSDPMKKLVVVSCDGSVKEQHVPGYPAWFNDEHQAVAWHDQYEGLVYYNNGMSEKISFGPHSGPDPSGRYFIKSPIPSHHIPMSVSCSTEIYNIKRPDLPLAKIAVCGIRRIFFKDEKVLLFGNDYCDQGNGKKSATTAHIFQMRRGEFIETEKVFINRPTESPAPFYVMDLSPWNDEVLFIDVYDFPSRSRLYIFNLKTHEMKKIGYIPFSGGWYFYLQCDIIKEVTNKLNERKPR